MKRKSHENVQLSAFSSKVKTKKEQVEEKKRPANVLLTSVSGFRSKSEKRQKYLSIYLEIFKGKVVKMSNDLLSILQNITGKKNIILFKI